MRRIAVLAFVVITSVGVTCADSWPWPTEKDYFSEDGKFVAHVTPPKYLKKDQPILEVFEIEQAQRVPFWQCRLGNEKAPLEVYVSDDGRYVVTINEHGKAGYGDHVVAFYNHNGRIKNYSLEEILHVPKNTSKWDMSHLIPLSTTSRWWDRNSIKFFNIYGDNLYFCVWLHLFDRWVAWNPTNGEEVKVDDKMVEQWNNKARLWSIKEIEKKNHSDIPYEFLGKVRNPADRPIIEKLLSDEVFIESAIRSQTKTLQDGSHTWSLELYTAGSRRRLMADRILAVWDGIPKDKRAGSQERPYCLGRIEGVVTLPRTDKPNMATLWIYLIPSVISKDQWYMKPPVHHLVAPFSHVSLRNLDPDYTREFPYAIACVTPGEYWVKAVLDKTGPFSKENDKFYLPQEGDYQSIESPIFAIKAGETVQNLTIDCIYRVNDETN